MLYINMNQMYFRSKMKDMDGKRKFSPQRIYFNSKFLLNNFANYI